MWQSQTSLLSFQKAAAAPCSVATCVLAAPAQAAGVNEQGVAAVLPPHTRPLPGGLCIPGILCLFYGPLQINPQPPHPTRTSAVPGSGRGRLDKLHAWSRPGAGTLLTGPTPQEDLYTLCLVPLPPDSAEEPLPPGSLPGFLPPLLPLSLWLHRWQDTTPVSFQVCKPDLSETPHVWVPEGATGVMELRRRVAGVALNSEEQSSHQLESGSTERLDRVAREAVQGTPAGPGGLGWVTPPGLRLC